MRRVGILVMLIALAAPAGAGELLFTNGSRLEGDLVNEVIIVSTGADLVEVAPDTVALLTPGEIRLKDGRVLLPDPTAAGKYAGAGWEEHVRKLPLVTPAVPGDPLPPRELIIGIELGGEARAYRFADLITQSPVLDRLGGREILIVVGEDGKSVRAFDRTVDGRALEFFARPGSPPLRLIDSQTGSEWDFTGGAIAGALEGRRLDRVAVLPEFWFDWRTYHPATDVHTAGLKRK